MYHSLPSVDQLADTDDFEFDRTKQLANAIAKHEDFQIVGRFRTQPQVTPKEETIVVDVECHSVPSRNEVGIQFRERLALIVPEDTKQLVQVWALRKGFPLLLHQNQHRLGSPASLCLYFESSAAVLRTWTPQNFLRRIQWWLIKSAKNELHPADQQVEQLFFLTKYELVLPWNFDDLKNKPDQKFVLRPQPERPDGGITLFAEPVPTNGHSLERVGSIVELTLPPIVQNQVENNPTTLGELSDLLLTRGTKLIPTLRESTQSLINEMGVRANTDGPFVVALLHIPITRQLGTPPERTSHRAFILLKGLLNLGASINALMCHDGTYFKDVMGKTNEASDAAWRSQDLFPMEVLREITPDVARAYSGLAEEGPKGLLIGAGSLGSTVLNLWSRSGWGSWTVIDKDHIKPHNLARHHAYAQHIGLPKAEVISQLHGAVMKGASKTTAINADASDLGNKTVSDALTAADLAIDISTTLEYPRLVSSVDGIARHMSAFIAPDGNAAVLLVEDNARKIRLRTLEAQYYRALIEKSWGKNHLNSRLGIFRSGASCRDVSMVLPYARIVGHAGNLAEQIQRAYIHTEPSITAWSRDPETGNVTAHSVSVYQEKRLQLDDMSLYIDDGLEEKLRYLRKAAAPKETGGILLGYYDLTLKMVVIVDAFTAPSDSASTEVSFERGINGLVTAVNEASQRTAGIVGYIGEWHSHPPGHSANPSRDDLIQLLQLSLGMAEDGFPAISLIVGHSDIQILKGSLLK